MLIQISHKLNNLLNTKYNIFFINNYLDLNIFYAIEDIHIFLNLRMCFTWQLLFCFCFFSLNFCSYFYTKFLVAIYNRNNRICAHFCK